MPTKANDYGPALIINVRHQLVKWVLTVHWKIFNESVNNLSQTEQFYSERVQVNDILFMLNIAFSLGEI